MRGSIIYWFFAALLLLLIQFHLRLAPYTKVEESFNIQAAHDFYTYGVPHHSANVTRFLQANFDHLTFSGAVPRSLTGAYVLSTIAEWIGDARQGLAGQLLIRSILGLLNGGALVFYGWGLMKSYGKGVAVWYLIFILSQFHVIYYASRPLPNMVAFTITTTAFKFFLPSTHWKFEQTVRDKTGIVLLTLAGVVLRSEIAILLAMVSLSLLARGRLSISKIISTGLFGAVLGLSITVPIDSFFWRRTLWAEFDGFYFNVMNGKASSWGVSPWHYYFTNALPKLLMNPMIYLICIPFALYRRKTRRNSFFVLFPPLAYITIYSLQPHKEWRFIVYAIPPICGAAGMGAFHIWSHRNQGILRRILSIGLLTSTFACLMTSTFVFLPVSMANYPGGQALSALQSHLAQSPADVSVWMDTYTCQTGVTRWLEVKHPSSLYPNATWTYDRTEDEDLKNDPLFWRKFNYVIVETDLIDKIPGKWQLFDEIHGFGGVKIVQQSVPTPGIDQLETRVLSEISGAHAEKVWKAISGLGKLVTRGLWVDFKMEPKVKILKQLDRDL
ncbi:dolichyl-P-Man:Man(7)GlcNAc(2)-PP-dolichol alpha-1,6-mannosyltransferase [Ascosphaera pollenicola]|nr:dolichyl-P-Man:Man(7)GlcNAc(2)-PP-dolichol alpha-1,6-mannosyltransferase [Ascosphaera pollenicola]